MKIQRRRPGELSSPRVSAGADVGRAEESALADAAVVIDVLRMTSTAAVLMRRPACAEIAVAATLDDLPQLARPVSDLVIVSEVRGASGLGAWIDNSPAQAEGFAFGARTPVLVTTNGTRALLAAAAGAAQVFTASFVDLHAIARHVAAAAPRDVLIVPAGHFAGGEARVEDDLCADALAAMLAGEEPDLAAAADAIRADPRVRRRVEEEPGFAADLDLALRGDPRAAALVFQPVGPGVGRIVRA